jgi:hypothetical protein
MSYVCGLRLGSTFCISCVDNVTNVTPDTVLVAAVTLGTAEGVLVASK